MDSGGAGPAATLLWREIVACSTRLGELLVGTGTPGGDDLAARIGDALRSARTGSAAGSGDALDPHDGVDPGDALDPGDGTAALRAVRVLTDRVADAAGAGHEAMRRFLAEQAGDARGALARLTGWEREMTALRLRLLTAPEVHDRLVRAVRDAVTRADGAAGAALRAFAEQPFDQSGGGLGREHTRIFAAPHHAREYVVYHCKPTLTAIDATVLACLSDLDGVVARCHADAVRDERDVRRLVAGGIAELAGADPPPVPDVPGPPRQVRVLGALHATVREAVRPVGPDLPLAHRVALAHSWPRDLRLTGHPGYVVARDAVHGSLAGAWRWAAATLRAKLEAYVEELWRGPLGRHFVARDDYLSRCEGAIGRARASRDAILATVLRDERELRDLTRRFAELRHAVDAVVAAVEGAR